MQQDLFTHAAEPHGGYRRTDPETSKEAGKAMTGEKLTKLQGLVLDYFAEFGPATDEQAQDYFIYHEGTSTIRSRRAELVKMGRIIDSGQRRLNRGNKRCIVWSLPK